MMIVSDYPQRDLEMLDLLAIKLPGGFTADQVTTLYDRLWRMTWRGRRLIGGHTTRFNEMRILNLSGMPTGDLGQKVEAFLNYEYRVSTSKAWGAFISKERYYDGAENGMGGSSQNERQVSEWGEYLRWKVGSILKMALEIERKRRRL
jgi:hypothetical protein